MNMKERLTSWATWLSLLGLIGILLNRFGVFARFGIDLGEWTYFVDYLGSVLIAFGILNNPTDKHNF